MTRISLLLLLAVAVFPGSLLAENDANSPTRETGAASSPVSTMVKEKMRQAGEAASVALAITALGADAFLEDHVRPLKEGQNQDSGNERIIFSAQYKKDSAYEEGRALGGTVLGAFNKCLSKQSHYEDPRVYGPGACERIKEYSPGYHSWENLKRDSKLYVFIPVVVVATALATCTSVCLYKKLKRD